MRIAKRGQKKISDDKQTKANKKKKGSNQKKCSIDNFMGK
jgi:hypothetical protein